MLVIRVGLRCASVTEAPLECRSCAMSWPLLPVPMTIARGPFQFSPSSYWLACSTQGRYGMAVAGVEPRGVEMLKAVKFREVRNAADAGRQHGVLRLQVPRDDVATAQPALG